MQEISKSLGLANAYAEGAHGFFNAGEYNRFIECAGEAWRLHRSARTFKLARRLLKAWIRLKLRN